MQISLTKILAEAMSTKPLSSKELNPLFCWTAYV